MATGGKFVWREGPAEVPDTMNILLDYPEGVTVQLVSSMANELDDRTHAARSQSDADLQQTGFEIKPQRPFAKEVKQVTHQKTGGERRGAAPSQPAECHSPRRGAEVPG